MTLSVLPTNQVGVFKSEGTAAVRCSTSIQYERIVSDLAKAFTDERPSHEPCADSIYVWLRRTREHFSKLEAIELAPPVAALALRIYRGEVTC